MYIDPNIYVRLITAEHADKPNFTGMIFQSCKPFAEINNLIQNFPNWYDIDLAVGKQLDTDGEWIGLTRYLDSPITGVYFSFDQSLTGFNKGVWKGPFDPTSGLVALPDEFYRALLKVKILNNHWDGSIIKAYEIASSIFLGLGFTLFIIDHANLTMAIGLVGQGPPDNLTLGLLTGGKFNIKPAGIKITNYQVQSVPGPLFGFDISNNVFAGFDLSGWATLL